MDEVVTVLVTLKEAGDPGNVGGGGVGAEMEPSHSAGLGGFPVTPAGVGGGMFCYSWGREFGDWGDPMYPGEAEGKKGLVTSERGAGQSERWGRSTD